MSQSLQVKYKRNVLLTPQFYWFDEIVNFSNKRQALCLTYLTPWLGVSYKTVMHQTPSN